MLKNVFRKMVLAAALLSSSALIFAVPAKQSEAVSQKITVEKVEGLSDDFMRGVDISALYDVESHGGKFYGADGKPQDLFKILKDSGVNWIRLRLWNNPTYAEDVKDKNGKVIAKKGSKYGGGNNSLEVDLDLAKRAKAAGFKLLVDFHYSDTWADPGKQTMPQDWAGLTYAQLENEVEKFTKESIEKFIQAGARPDAVQIGNELNSGFMWPAGQIWSNDKNAKIGGMAEFTKLLGRASAGVRAARNGGDKIKVVIHLANGGDQELYKWVFDEVTKAGVDYDIIGLSFYTYWHGSPDDLKANLEMLSNRYGKQMAVMETAYAFTDEDGDDQGNVFLTFSDTNHGYVPSVQGQATAVRDVIAAVASVKGGCGVFYWEPAWLPVKGAGLSSTQGNTWENQNMFDFKGRVLPSLNVFGLVKGENPVTNVWGGSASNGKGNSIYAMADKVEVTAKPGDTPALPDSVKVVYSDDSETSVKVKWEPKDWKNEKAGKVQVSGTIAGTDFKPTATVELTEKTNVIADPSFESGKLGSWKLNGSGTACYIENNKGNAHTGKWTYKYWLGSGFKSVLSQKLENLPDGTYQLSVWAMGGGGENDIRLFAADFDGSKNQVTAKITNTGWQNWKQYRIKVPVKGGKITVGIYLDTKPDCWGNFDDVELVKIDDRLTSEGEKDGFAVPLTEDLSKAVSNEEPAAAAAGTASKSKVLQGLWIETTSHNNSLIRNISDGTKKGYEFDNSHFTSEANWWFWGEINKTFHLDAEIAVWNFDKTLYQANTYGANVPDVTWGDGLQTVASMPFALLKNANDEGVGTFNKMGLNLTSPVIDARFGYGNLKANGMSTFKGIYTVIDRWNDVGNGYTEIKNGSGWREIGDFKIDFLAALSEMRDTYGTYDYLDVKYSDKAEAALTFGSTTTEEKLFYYNRTNENAFSAYAAVTPVGSLKIEGHYLGSFGTETDLNGASSAGAGKISLNGETWSASVMQSVAGVNADSVWGSDGQDYDDINADTATTQIDLKKDFASSKLKFSLGLDQGITFNDSDDLGNGLMELRSQPYADFDLSSLTGVDLTLGAYGVFSFDRLAESTSADRNTIFSFDEAGVEFVLSDAASYLKKLTFDYGVSIDYNDWEENNSYPVYKSYHSVMANAQLTDRLNIHAGALARVMGEEDDDTNVPLAFSLGFKLNNIKFPGKPHLWVHFTYGMNPYEDNNYSLYRADDPLNKKVHRTYLLNSLDSDTTTSQVSVGLIWDL